MRAVVQRVLEASVSIEGDVVGKIGRGLLVYLGIGKDDEAFVDTRIEWLAGKIANLRIFENQEGKMMHALGDAHGEGKKGSLLIISQFTLYGDVKKGNRPSFQDAMQPDLAKLAYENFCKRCARDFPVETGRFGATMAVRSINDGPVTIWIETPK
jgi:D-aminoacyl-tRNA deacylase